MSVPFLDLRSMHEEVRAEIEAGWRDLIERSAFVGGPAVAGVERRRRRPVTALLPVDLYGQAADWDPLLELAGRFGLKVVEDACQAHGARYHGRSCGTFGDAAAFSFYPGKNLGAMGEAGAITTGSAAVAERCRVLRDHGQRERYIHVTGEGGNARLDAVQAVVLNAKLPRLEAWNDARRDVA